MLCRGRRGGTWSEGGEAAEFVDHTFLLKVDLEDGGEFLHEVLADLEPSHDNVVVTGREEAFMKVVVRDD